MRLLGIWKSSQTDQQRLVSNFLEKLEDGQKKGGANSLNALITKIKENVPTGMNFISEYQIGNQVLLKVLILKRIYLF